MVVPRPLNILVTRSFSITSDQGLTSVSCSSDAQRGEYPDDTENEAAVSPTQAGLLEDWVTPPPEGFSHALAPAPSTSRNHNVRNDEGLLDAEPFAIPSRVAGPNIPDWYCSHGLPSPPLSAVGSASPPLSFSPDAPPPSPIEPLRRLSVQEASEHPRTQSNVSGAHQSLALVQFDGENLASTGTAPLHAIDLRSCEDLDGLVSGLFHCLQIGRVIQIIGVPFPDLGKWIDRLTEAGFWSINAEFLPLGTKVGAVAYVNVSAVKPVTSTPTFWEIQEHDPIAESFARNHFISLAIQVLNNDPDRLPDLRQLMSIDLDLRAWFEAELFQLIRKDAGVAAEAMFRRYLRYIATAMDNGKPRAPSNLLWLVDKGKPPPNCSNILDDIAFCRLLLDCAGGQKNDLDICCYTQDDVEGVRELCQHIDREYPLHVDAVDLGGQWRTLCVSEDDFSDGLWAMMLLEEGAKLVNRPPLEGYRLVQVCQSAFTWLENLLDDAGHEKRWTELDAGVGTVVSFQ